MDPQNTSALPPSHLIFPPLAALYHCNNSARPSIQQQIRTRKLAIKELKLKNNHGCGEWRRTRTMLTLVALFYPLCCHIALHTMPSEATGLAALDNAL